MATPIVDPLRTTYLPGDHDPANALNATNLRVNQLTALTLSGVVGSGSGEAIGSDPWLIAITNGELFTINSATYDANGAIESASIEWPDGSSGTFTTLVASDDFPGAIDSFQVTYVNTSTKTIIQPTITRDANGRVTAQPTLLISA